ncbi:uncharacterized protein LOC117557567 [Gymnodraco acuticeps]|uniref:Uncharacterized protein LOC117557567 n=1 Tax=Gymnodraco acuticeps TaxID=8218 RepID=A0A6P8VG74_GYMAC|nr:uncharacterized protein LOC117557567 [Gymnodraco acuticeps]
MHELGLTGKKAQISLRTMGQERAIDSHIVFGLEVAGLTNDNFCELPQSYTQECMPASSGNIPRQADLQRWPHLKNVNLPEINAGIGLLIGTNVPKALEPLEVIRSVEDRPYASRRVIGPLEGVSGNAMDFDKPEVSVNRISVVNLDGPWQQQFSADFPECRLEEQAGCQERISSLRSLQRVFFQKCKKKSFKDEKKPHLKSQQKPSPSTAAQKGPAADKEMENRMKWTNVFYKAEGLGVKDDEDMLRSSLKEWGDQSENIVEKMQKQQEETEEHQ